MLACALVRATPRTVSGKTASRIRSSSHSGRGERAWLRAWLAGVPGRLPLPSYGYCQGAVNVNAVLGKAPLARSRAQCPTRRRSPCTTRPSTPPTSMRRAWRGLESGWKWASVSLGRAAAAHTVSPTSHQGLRRSAIRGSQDAALIACAVAKDHQHLDRLWRRRGRPSRGRPPRGRGSPAGSRRDERKEDGHGRQRRAACGAPESRAEAHGGHS